MPPYPDRRSLLRVQNQSPPTRDDSAPRPLPLVRRLMIAVCTSAPHVHARPSHVPTRPYYVPLTSLAHPHMSLRVLQVPRITPRSLSRPSHVPLTFPHVSRTSSLSLARNHTSLARPHTSLARPPGRILLWDLVDGTLLHTLAGHSHVVTSLAYHPTITALLSSSVDRSVPPGANCDTELEKL